MRRKAMAGVPLSLSDISGNVQPQKFLENAAIRQTFTVIMPA